jgi:hypothetical protein
VRDVELAYTAGLLDGEGCLSLASRNVDIGRRWVKVVCEINNTKPEVLFWIVSLLDYGRVYEKPRKYGKTYTLCFNATESRKLIPRLQPYLIIKQEQAKLLVEYFEVIDTMKNTKDPKRKELVDAIHLKLKALNRRGPICGT